MSGGRPTPRKERIASTRMAKAHDVGALHQQRRDAVGQDVAEHDPAGRRAERDRRLDVGLLADRQHQRAHQARDARDLGDGDGDDHRADAGAPQRHQRDGEQDGGNRHQAVHHAHQRPVQPAQVAGAQAEHDAEGERQRRGGDADQQRHARAVEHAAVDVAAEGVRAHEEGVLQRLALERQDLAALARPQVAAGRRRTATDRRCPARARRLRARAAARAQQAADAHRPVAEDHQ